jgi:hypothetical protein
MLLSDHPEATLFFVPNCVPGFLAPDVPRRVGTVKIMDDLGKPLLLFHQIFPIHFQNGEQAQVGLPLLHGIPFEIKSAHRRVQEQGA